MIFHKALFETIKKTQGYSLTAGNAPIDVAEAKKATVAGKSRLPWKSEISERSAYARMAAVRIEGKPEMGGRTITLSKQRPRERLMLL